MFQRVWDWGFVANYASTSEARRQVCYQNIQKPSLIKSIQVEQYGIINHYVLYINFYEDTLLEANLITDRIKHKIDYRDKSNIKVMLDEHFRNHALPFQICVEVFINLELVSTPEEILSDLREELEKYGPESTFKKVLGYTKSISQLSSNQSAKFKLSTLLISMLDLIRDRFAAADLIPILEYIEDPIACYELANKILFTDEFFSQFDLPTKLKIALKFSISSKDKTLINVVFNQLTLADPQAYSHSLVEFSVPENFNYEQLIFMAECLRQKNLLIDKQQKEILCLQKSLNINEPPARPLQPHHFFQPSASASASASQGSDSAKATSHLPLDYDL